MEFIISVRHFIHFLVMWLESRIPLHMPVKEEVIRASNVRHIRKGCAVTEWKRKITSVIKAVAAAHVYSPKDRKIITASLDEEKLIAMRFNLAGKDTAVLIHNIGIA